ncbi:hypothetical protein D9M69_500950 [compost metagenome]
MPSRPDEAMGPNGREKLGNERFVLPEFSGRVGQHDRRCFKKPIPKRGQAKTWLNGQAVPLEGNRADVPASPPSAVPCTVDDGLVLIPLARDGNDKIRCSDICYELTEPIHLCRCRLRDERRAVTRD